MSDSLLTRAFAAADEPGVIALWTACGLTRPWNDPRNGELVATAMAGYDGHRGWINYLAVHPAHRRCGLARRLLREAEDALARIGCPKVNLQIRSTNLEAVAFYRAIGYLPDDVVCYGKRLIDDLPTDPSTAR